MIFDKLENSLKGGAFENILKDIFGGKMKYEMICSECGNKNVREEEFYKTSSIIAASFSSKESMSTIVKIFS